MGVFCLFTWCFIPVQTIAQPLGLVITHCKHFSFEYSLLTKSRQNHHGYLTVIMNVLNNRELFANFLITFCVAHDNFIKAELAVLL